MNRLFYYQAVYPVAGTLSNMASWIMMRDGGLGLSPTDPVKGLVVMGIVAAIIAIGVAGYRRTCALLLTIPIYFCGGAVWGHVNNMHFADWSTLYASLFTWSIAVGINLYGLAIFTWSIIHEFVRRSPQAGA